MPKKYCILFLGLLLFFNLRAGCGPGQVQVIVTIVPDAYPHETSWSLYDGISNLLLDSGAYNSDTLCVGTSECLKFTIYDSYGDGMCCVYGHGYYTVTVNGNLVDSGGRFTYSQYAYFNCPVGYACSNPFIASADTMTAPFPESWYLFVPDSTGIYDIQTCGLGNNCRPKLYVYDHCTGILISQDNEGTTFYADTNCANGQAQINAFMTAGQAYYIRIGQNDTSCKGDSIKWLIRYNGPLSGCTDSTSCNYNPLASINDGSCLYPPNPLCPAPDLTVVQADLINSLTSDSLVVGAINCYVGEGCLAGYGTRSLIRFTTHIRNIGNQDYYIGLPDTAGGAFVFDLCHNHWHYVGYAEYLMFDSHNQPVQAGFKNGFCVEDVECDSLGAAKYGCSNMGITTACGDVYAAGLDCQWIDITDIDTGNYTLAVGVNWNHKPDKLGHYERTYDNNWAQVCLHIYFNSNHFKTFSVLPFCPIYTDCAGDTFGSASLDCKGVCNGSAVRGDLNGDLAADSTDLAAYINGVVQDTIPVTTCDDLNGDGAMTITDAVRLSGCILYNEGLFHTPSNYQNTHRHCEFPFNVFNPLDTVTFSIAHVDWQHKYVDLSVYNPACYLLAFELKTRGMLVDSIANLATTYNPVLRTSQSGHMAGIAVDGNGLVKQLAPLRFMRVYYRSLTDTQICIQQIITASNGNYEEVKGLVGNPCVSVPDSVVTLTETVSPDDILIVPNPGSGVFTVYLTNHSLSPTRWALNDLQGRQILKSTDTNFANSLQLDLSGMESGVYLLNLSVDGRMMVKRLVLVGK